ncbi:magnesium transporter [bacterium]|nr:magnesium transporter [bacterium]
MAPQKSFENKFFLADVIDSPVYEPTGELAGTIINLTIMLGDKYPKLPQVLIQTSVNGEKRLASRSQFKDFCSERPILLVPPSELSRIEEIPEQVLVKSIWDKQIVDISDARVVRVNDLEIAELKGELHLIGVDIGIRGLFRRMGWEKWLCPIVEKFRGEVKNDVISWDFVESLPTNFSRIKLTVPSQKIKDLHPADLADILDDLSVHEGLNFIKALDDETAAETLAEAESETQLQIITHMPSEKASDLLEEMEPDEAVDILQDLDKRKAEEILEHMEREEASEVRELLKHEENSAGGLMSTGYATIYDDFTIAEAFSYLRLVALDLEIIYYIYVLDRKDHLRGVVSIRNLIVADPNVQVVKVMNDKVIHVSPETCQEEVANLISKYDLIALPVVDPDLRMLGVVSVDDVINLLMDHMPRVWKRRALSS